MDKHRLEPIEIRFDHPMRDPTGNAQRYEEICSYFFERLNGPDLDKYTNNDDCVIERGSYLYAMGVPVGDMVHRLLDDLPFLQEQSPRTSLRLNYFRDLRYLSLALLLLPTTSDVQSLTALVDQYPKPGTLLYGPDLLIKAFNPDWKLAKKYPRNTKWTPPVWTDTLVSVLAASPATKSEELGKHMARWCRLMKPFGWKPVRDYSHEAAEKRGELEDVFIHFAFEAALVVCAYDLDDSSFRDHLYYPRDLVDHYRTHVRHTRDAWRDEGVGAGVSVQPPPPPKRVDLAKSKRKGLARWLELVSDGDMDALEAVLEEHGNVRKIGDVGALSAVLGEQSVGVHADIKDDDTLLAQLDGLAQARGLGEFASPDSPAGVVMAGPGRCEYLLQFAADWFRSHDYKLLALDVDGDAWSAVAVRSDHAEELHGLGEKLGIRSAEPALELHGRLQKIIVDK